MTKMAGSNRQEKRDALLSEEGANMPDASSAMLTHRGAVQGA
jgi:hypothetical protein